MKVQQGYNQISIPWIDLLIFGISTGMLRGNCTTDGCNQTRSHADIFVKSREMRAKFPSFACDDYISHLLPNEIFVLYIAETGCSCALLI